MCSRSSNNTLKQASDNTPLSAANEWCLGGGRGSEGRGTGGGGRGTVGGGRGTGGGPVVQGGISKHIHYNLYFPRLCITA